MNGRNSAILPGRYKSITTVELIPREYTDYVPVKRRSFITVPASSISSYPTQTFPSYSPEISSKYTTSGNSPYIQLQPNYIQQNSVYNSFINPNIIGNGFQTHYVPGPSLEEAYIPPPHYTLIQNIPNYKLDYLRDLNINISDISLTDPLLNN